MPGTESIQQFDFNRGMITRGVSPLSTPPDTLIAGKNVLLADGGIKCRKGMEEELIGPRLPVVAQKALQTDLTIQYHASVFDPVNNQMLTYGGEGSIIGHPSPYWFTFDPVTSTLSQFTPGTGSADARMGHSMVWDEVNEQCLIFGGETAVDQVNELLSYDPATDTISTLSPTGTPPSIREGHIACYDSVNHCMWVFGGYSWTGYVYKNDLWKYDIAANTWSEITPDNAGPSIRAQMAGDYDSTNACWWIHGGWNGATTYGDLWKYVPATNEWTQVRVTAGGESPNPGTQRRHNLVYFAAKNKLVLTRADDEFSPVQSSWEYNITGDIWSDLTSIWPVYICVGWGLTGVYYDSALYLFGGHNSNKVFKFDYSGEIYGEILVCKQVRFPGSETTYILAQIKTATENKFYACTDHLPATPAVAPLSNFQEIYDLGAGAGTVSIDVLGDRCIITEGINEPPLVFSGGLAAGGSDWASPKAVLLKRGSSSHYEDITQAVCDQDSTNSAQVGGMLLDGQIIIILDVPQFSALRFDMETVNTGLAAGAADFTETITFTDTADLDTFDCSFGETPHWIQDAAATGHFEGPTVTLTEGQAVINEGGGNVGLVCVGSPITEGMIVEVRGSHANYNGTRTAQAGTVATKIIINATYAAHTVGAGETVNQRVKVGNTAYWTHISPGVLVNFADVSTNIVAITDMGEADGEVELQTAHATADVASITGIELSNSTLRWAYANADESATILTQTLSGSTNLAGYSLRVIVRGADLSATGTDPVFVTKVGTPYGASCTHLSIVQQSTGANGNATPTEILTEGQHGWVGAAGEEITHDAVTGFTVDTGQNYIVTYDMEYTTVPVNGGGEQTGVSSEVYDAWRASEPPYSDNVWNNESAAHLNWRLSIPAQRYVPVYAPTYTTTLPTGALTEGTGSGGGYYWKAPSGTTAIESWDDQTVSGFTLAAGKSVGIKTITANTATTVLPTQAAVACTTSSSHLSIGHIESIKQVVETDNGSGVQWRAVSFDELVTLWVFKTGAWYNVVKFDTVWQYRDAGGAWQSAAHNSMLGAWWEAAAIAANQMSKAELQAITEAQWSLTNGFVPHVTAYLDFAWYADESAGAIPTLTSVAVKYSDTGSAVVKFWQGGAWTEGSGFTDNTSSGGIPLSQDGTITYNGGTATVDYGVVSEVHGYPVAFSVQGTSATTAITKIRYQAPCQPLATIAANQPDPPLAFIVMDASTGTQIDYAKQVQDDINTELSVAPIPLEAADEICITGLTPFNIIELTPLIPNGNTALLSATYWNGTSRQALPISDLTSVNGKTCATKGKISFTLPDDFRDAIPYEGKSERGYNVWLKVSASLSATASIAECRLYSVPEERPKYRHAVVVQDRLYLLDRPDNRSQCDESRALEEFGFCGTDSRADENGLIAGQGTISAVFGAWGNVFVAFPDSFSQLVGNDPQNQYFGRVEAAGLTPINSRVCVMAPRSWADGDRYALYFLNTRGAYCVSNAQADQVYGAMQAADLSLGVNWWQDGTHERLDRNYLYLASAVFWPRDNQIIFTVPMIVAGGTEQTTNNCLIVWDLTLNGGRGGWLPPFWIPAASLCTAYDYNATAPGKLGQLELYAGGYDGKIYRLFEADDDAGIPIEWDAKSRVAFGRVTARARYVVAFGRGELGSTAQLEIFRNGEEAATTSETRVFNDLIAPTGKSITLEPRSLDLEGNLFELKFSGTGPTTIYGEMGFQPVRDPFGKGAI